MTTTTPTTSSVSHADLMRSLDLFEVKPGIRFDVNTLRELLPDVETLLFFGKVYNLDASQLAALLHKVLNTDLTRALFAEGTEHSNELQDYLLDGYYDDDGDWYEPIVGPAQAGDVVLKPDIPHGEILPQVWESLEVVVAKSIVEAAAKFESVISRLPGKQGNMLFRSLLKLNRQRPTLGVHNAAIQHERQKENLAILDVSGSMTERTVRAIVSDVVALSYNANAHFAIVSNNCYYWQPGTYDVDTILAKAQYGGTHYEELKDLFDRDWGTVITVADYDSSRSAAQELAKCHGRIDQVLDISLVNRPTFLAQCVGQLATNVKPILIGSGPYVLA